MNADANLLMYIISSKESHYLNNKGLWTDNKNSATFYDTFAEASNFLAKVLELFPALVDLRPTVINYYDFFNLQEIKPGTILVSKHGNFYIYAGYYFGDNLAKFPKALEHALQIYPHLLIGIENSSFVTRIDGGFVYLNDRLSTDDDIVALATESQIKKISKKKLKSAEKLFRKECTK